MTLLVRDEADVVDAQISYHLDAGVDFVIATDHESRDGTTEILESYARQGVLHLIRESGAVQESGWRTHMARMAAREFDADWVINTDADEFWLPSRGTLKEVFAAVPEAFGGVTALSRHFAPRPEDGRSFAERMIFYVSGSAAINDPTSPYRPSTKSAHRADPTVVVEHGAHSAHTRLPPVPNWHPVDVAHFPYRTKAQYVQKNARRAHGVHSLGQYVRGDSAQREGRLDEVYGALVVDDATVERGIATGSLVMDTRLRDALTPMEAPAVSEIARTAASQHRAVVDSAVLRAANLVRLQRSVDDLSAQLKTLEHGPRQIRVPSLPRFGEPRTARLATRLAATAVAVLLVFAVVPELLGDRPYDPKPSSWVRAVESLPGDLGVEGTTPEA